MINALLWRLAWHWAEAMDSNYVNRPWRWIENNTRVIWKR
jgi:hypothetical protein